MVVSAVFDKRRSAVSDDVTSCWPGARHISGFCSNWLFLFNHTFLCNNTTFSVLRSHPNGCLMVVPPTPLVHRGCGVAERYCRRRNTLRSY
ncbi:hypothetical protein CEXT_596111 [Caerostris extrusa]|uniref:Uncharacterized protein n=1 Tax=Caerostris extrusa TaxID=172846 RepID=A0AAV4SP46_CAEEX|nr:hypothetical protein CEXT_596111 [Caerostris extrusa]